MKPRRNVVKMGFERAVQPPPRRHYVSAEEAAANAAAEARDRRRYRIMVFGRPVSPWRPTLADAHRDAVRLGHGTADRRLGQFFMTVPAWIQQREL